MTSLESGDLEGPRTLRTQFREKCRVDGMDGWMYSGGVWGLEAADHIKAAADAARLLTGCLIGLYPVSA